MKILDCDTLHQRCACINSIFDQLVVKRETADIVEEWRLLPIVNSEAVRSIHDATFALALEEVVPVIDDVVKLLNVDTEATAACLFAGELRAVY